MEGGGGAEVRGQVWGLRGLRPSKDHRISIISDCRRLGRGSMEVPLKYITYVGFYFYSIYSISISILFTHRYF